MARSKSINSKYTKNPAGIAAPETHFNDETTPLEKTPIEVMNESFFYIAANGISRVCQETKRQGKFHLEKFPVFQFHEKNLTQQQRNAILATFESKIMYDFGKKLQKLPDKVSVILS